MDPTISVSKGCFVYKNGATRASKSVKKTTKRKHGSTTSVLDTEVTEQPFHKVYSQNWQKFQKHIETLQEQSNARILNDLVDYVTNETLSTNCLESYGIEDILPTAALLTGINQVDHLEQFETLSQHIRSKMSASVCVLQSRDCPNIKSAIETMVYNFVEEPLEECEDRDHKRLRRSQCTIKQLKYWYNNNFSIENNESKENLEEDSDISEKETRSTSHALVVILHDFECFNTSVLQDFILILSANRAQLPFVLILGIATGVSAVHSALPYNVTCKIKLRIFQTQAALVGLNDIVDKVILSPKYAFHLSGKALKFLTHIFLYYDFSLNGFIQGFKYCLMEHYFQGNAYALCTSYAASLMKIKSMTHDDMETIRRLLSFRPYVEGINDCKRIIAILTDDDYLKKKLPQLLRDCHVHFMVMRTFLEFLTALVNDLPKCPLGKFRRELYAICLSKDLVTQPEFRECWQYLSLMSKDEFVAKISSAIKATQEFLLTEVDSLELANDCATIVEAKLTTVKELLTNIVMSGVETKKNEKKTNSGEELKQLSSRQDLKERLLQLSKQEKPGSEFTKAVDEILKYIQTEIVECHLTPLQRAPPLHELFFFTDISVVRKNIIGAPRAALHMALNNPHFYLQCKCCQLEEHTQLLQTLPDLSVAYKLHLECGRMINLFDWLQAFRSVVDYSEEENDQVDPQIQARFTRAVAELQFLGYIKMSKRKTDHATRLTW
ncbi:origin recognition complex subunit 3 [Teleopsis dalmanni]|uniref:origin recognition complex subunit 3 n=1 Tax=Teleopsis dalmanni TaxID=139649 RepID=UPI0018CE4CAB|nr:origin recognition complex subunit 3 [Teleopsis dalmanni]